MVACHRIRRWAVPAGIALVLSHPAGHAQEVARVRQGENFRRTPNGELLARLEPGTPLRVVERQGRWTEVDLEGWVWTPSLEVSDRDDFDLVVSAPGGENLRGAPSGEVLGRLERGTLLDEIERGTGWIRVRRRGWIWGPSLAEASPAAEPAVDAPPPDAGAASGAEAGPAARRPEGVVVTGAAGAAVLTAPSGDTLALAVPLTELEVLARQGSWARVRIDGWAWLPPVDSADAEPAAPAPLTPERLAEEPDAYRGRMVSWTVQFISVERAERVRTDFFEGEPFLLTRFGGAEGPFVYVAVPPERLREVSGLTPLEPLTVEGRIRTGASALTRTPIVDLVSISRVRAAR